jgi:Domain of unknown function (DUF4158)
MARSLNLDELVEHWTLLDDEQKLIAGKRGPTRLGFALLLKFYTRAGRFPRGRGELPNQAVEFVARQVGVAPSDLGFYEWTGRTIEYHRAQIRAHLGFRECSVADADKLAGWLAANVCEAERRPELVRDELLVRCRAERIEPPAAGRIDRTVRSALHHAEQALTARIAARLPADAAARLRALVEAGVPDDDAGEDSVLALIKSVPGNVSLDSMLTEIRKLRAVRAIGLPAGLFSDVAPRVVGSWRARAAVEAPSHLRDHPEPLMLTLLATLLHTRLREITDTLVELLISTVHRIGARADKKVTEELVNAFKRVTGKENILFAIAEASLGRPDDPVRQVVYPAVAGGEQPLRELVQEFRTKGPVYRRTVQTTLKASYSNHYRRGLIELLDVLEFRSGNATHRPVLDALGLIRRHADTRLTYYPAGETVPAHKELLGDWAPLVFTDAGKVGQRVVRAVYEICTFQALRERLRCKEIWVVGADKWRNPDEDLPQDFEVHRAAHYAALRKPLDPTAFIGQLRAEMSTELAAGRRGAQAAMAGDRRPGQKRPRQADRPGRSAGAEHLAPPESRGAHPMGHRPADRHAQGGGAAHRMPRLGHRVGRPRRPGPRGPGRTAAAGHLRLRHQHRYPRHRRQRPARPRRGRHPVRTPPVPDCRDGPGHRRRDRQRHVRRPRPCHLGRRLHCGRLGFDALRRVRPEHFHRMALSLRNWSTRGFPGPDLGRIAASQQVSTYLDCRSQPYRILPLLPGFLERFV